MSKKAFLAVIETPLGVWESTACLCSGHEAEFRARRNAQRAFVLETLPPFMKDNLETLFDIYWRTAVQNGCKCIVKEVTLEQS